MLIIDEKLSNIFNIGCGKNKIMEYLHKAQNLMLSTLTDTSEINYLSLEKGSQIGFIANNKEFHYHDNWVWDSKNRQTGKPSKIIRRILPKESLRLFKEKDFEEFANLVKSRGLDTKYKFEIIDSYDIHHSYKMDLDGYGGSLSGSCMHKRQFMFSLYVDNPDVCKMIRLINTETNRIAGRALLWTMSNGKTFMDRIYYISDYMVDLFKDFAMENDIDYMKAEQSYDSKHNFLNLKTNMREDFEASVVLKTDYKSFPYLDTFSYLKQGEIFNHKPDGCNYILTNTDGLPTVNKAIKGSENFTNVRIKSIDSDEFLEEERYCYTAGQYAGEEIEDDDYVVEVDGELYHTDDDEIVWANDRDEYILRDDAFFCCDTDDFRSSGVYVGNEDNYYHYTDNLVTINGDWYNIDSDDICYCDRNDEYYLSEDCVWSELTSEYILESESVEIDGDYYHVDSDDIVETENNEWILVENSVIIDGAVYSINSDEVVENYDSEYILYSESVEIDGNYYHNSDERIVEDDEGNYTLSQ